MITEVYRGAPSLVHIKDGERQSVGRYSALIMSALIRNLAIKDGAQPASVRDKPICPGCYMVVIFNQAVALAHANGQSLTELANSMIGAFEQLRDYGITAREDIEVRLDPC